MLHHFVAAASQVAFAYQGICEAGRTQLGGVETLSASGLVLCVFRCVAVSVARFAWAVLREVLYFLWCLCTLHAASWLLLVVGYWMVFVLVCYLVFCTRIYPYSGRELKSRAFLQRHPDYDLSKFATDERACAYCQQAHTVTISAESGDAGLLINIPANRCASHVLFPRHCDVQVPAKAYRAAGLKCPIGVYTVPGTAGTGKTVTNRYDLIGASGTEEAQGLALGQGFNIANGAIAETVIRAAAMAHFCGTVIEHGAVGNYLPRGTGLMTPCDPAAEHDKSRLLEVSATRRAYAEQRRFWERVTAVPLQGVHAVQGWRDYSSYQVLPRWGQSHLWAFFFFMLGQTRMLRKVHPLWSLARIVFSHVPYWWRGFKDGAADAFRSVRRRYSNWRAGGGGDGDDAAPGGGPPGGRRSCGCCRRWCTIVGSALSPLVTAVPRPPALDAAQPFLDVELALPATPVAAAVIPQAVRCVQPPVVAPIVNIAPVAPQPPLGVVPPLASLPVPQGRPVALRVSFADDVAAATEVVDVSAAVILSEEPPLIREVEVAVTEVIAPAGIDLGFGLEVVRAEDLPPGVQPLTAAEIVAVVLAREEVVSFVAPPGLCLAPAVTDAERDALMGIVRFVDKPERVSPVFGQRYHSPYAPVMGSVYPFDVTRRLEGPGWRRKVLKESKKTIVRDIKLAKNQRARAAVEAGDSVASACGRWGCGVAARVLLPMPISSVFFIADPVAESNIDMALRDRHYREAEHPVYGPGMMALVSTIAEVIGARLATSDVLPIERTAVEKHLPGSWSAQMRTEAFQDAVVRVRGDKDFATKAVRRFMVKPDENLSKAKPRGILAESTPALTVIHAIASVTLEHAIKRTGLTERSFKGVSGDGQNLRMLRLIGNNVRSPSGVPLVKTCSADFGKFDSTMSVELREAAEGKLLNTFLDALGMGVEASFWEHCRRSDRGKDTLTFETLYARIRTKVFGRSSGDRLTSTGNWIINLILKLAFMHEIGLDWREILDHLWTPLSKDKLQDHSKRLYDFIAEGDDNQDFFSNETIARCAAAAASDKPPKYCVTSWETLYDAELAFYNSLAMFWEPAENDCEIAGTAAAAYRAADERSEFVSRHFMYHSGRSRCGRRTGAAVVTSFPKFTKFLTTAQVSFCKTPLTHANIGVVNFQNCRVNSASSPLLAKFSECMQRFYAGDETAPAVTATKKYHDTRHERFARHEVEKQVEAARCPSVDALAKQLRERSTWLDWEARAYVAANYSQLGVDVQERMESAFTGAVEWSVIGDLYDELYSRSYGVWVESA